MCGAADATLLCSRCRRVHYCGTLCQKKAWKAHRAECGVDPAPPAPPAPEVGEADLRAIDTMRPAEVIELLLRPGEASPKVTLVAVRRLGILAQSDPVSRTIARGGGFRALLKAVAEYASNDLAVGVNIVFYAVAALAGLIEVPENGPTFSEAARAGGISTLVGALRTSLLRLGSGSAVARERLEPTVENAVFALMILLTHDSRAAAELVAVHAERVLAAALTALALANANVAGYASCALFRLVGLSPTARGCDRGARRRGSASAPSFSHVRPPPSQARPRRGRRPPRPPRPRRAPAGRQSHGVDRLGPRAALSALGRRQ